MTRPPFEKMELAEIRLPVLATNLTNTQSLSLKAITLASPRAVLPTVLLGASMYVASPE